MSKRYFLFQLQQLESWKIIEILNSWGIKQSGSKQKLIEKIYNHQNNQFTSNTLDAKKKKRCNASTIATCCIDDCKNHPQAKFESQGLNYKHEPTKFYRAPLPICWLIAPIQFLSSISWNESCFAFINSKPQHLFSKFFKMIQISRFDTSGNTFKAAPLAQKFIDEFRPQWSIKKQHDAAEFITAFLGNIQLFNERNAPKAFFKDSQDTVVKNIIRFVNEQLTIAYFEHFQCRKCGKNYLGSHGKVQRLRSIDLTVPENEQSLVSVQQLINQFQKAEILDEYICAVCHKKGTTAKRFSLQSNPKFIIVKLKRWKCNSKTQKTSKITSPVDLNDMMTIETSSGKQAYKLISVLNHEGTTMHQGHYVTIRTIQGNLWKCDDDHSTRCNAQDKKSATVLLYVKNSCSEIKAKNSRKRERTDAFPEAKQMTSKVKNKRLKTSSSKAKSVP